MNQDFILLDNKTTVADILIAVKMKWGVVLLNDMLIEAVSVDSQLKFKVSVRLTKTFLTQ